MFALKEKRVAAKTGKNNEWITRKIWKISSPLQAESVNPCLRKQRENKTTQNKCWREGRRLQITASKYEIFKLLNSLLTITKRRDIEKLSGRRKKNIMHQMKTLYKYLPHKWRWTCFFNHPRLLSADKASSTNTTASTHTTHKLINLIAALNAGLVAQSSRRDLFSGSEIANSLANTGQRLLYWIKLNHRRKLLIVQKL